MTWGIAWILSRAKFLISDNYSIHYLANSASPGKQTTKWCVCAYEVEFNQK